MEPNAPWWVHTRERGIPRLLAMTFVCGIGVVLGVVLVVNAGRPLAAIFFSAVPLFWSYATFSTIATILWSRRIGTSDAVSPKAKTPRGLMLKRDIVNTILGLYVWPSAYLIGSLALTLWACITMVQQGRAALWAEQLPLLALLGGLSACFAAVLLLIVHSPHRREERRRDYAVFRARAFEETAYDEVDA